MTELPTLLSIHLIFTKYQLRDQLQHRASLLPHNHFQVLYGGVGTVPCDTIHEPVCFNESILTHLLRQKHPQTLHPVHYRVTFLHIGQLHGLTVHFEFTQRQHRIGDWLVSEFLIPSFLAFGVRVIPTQSNNLIYNALVIIHPLVSRSIRCLRRRLTIHPLSNVLILCTILLHLRWRGGGRVRGHIISGAGAGLFPPLGHHRGSPATRHMFLMLHNGLTPDFGFNPLPIPCRLPPHFQVGLLLCLDLLLLGASWRPSLLLLLLLLLLLRRLLRRCTVPVVLPAEAFLVSLCLTSHLHVSLSLLRQNFSLVRWRMHPIPPLPHLHGGGGGGVSGVGRGVGLVALLPSHFVALGLPPHLQVCLPLLCTEFLLPLFLSIPCILRGRRRRRSRAPDDLIFSPPPVSVGGAACFPVRRCSRVFGASRAALVVALLVTLLVGLPTFVKLGGRVGLLLLEAGLPLFLPLSVLLSDTLPLFQELLLLLLLPLPPLLQLLLLPALFILPLLSLTLPSTLLPFQPFLTRLFLPLHALYFSILVDSLKLPHLLPSLVLAQLFSLVALHLLEALSKVAVLSTRDDVRCFPPCVILLCLQLRKQPVSTTPTWHPRGGRDGAASLLCLCPFLGIRPFEHLLFVTDQALTLFYSPTEVTSQLCKMLLHVSCI
eukprot:Hpha_TRINITY_DN15374_c1_g9::TRINITY_DN15374_c1_g9_i1::g.90681::m.90681